VADKRREPRIRNNRKTKKSLNIVPIVTALSVVIIILTGILAYKSYEERNLAAREQNKINERIYVLFEEINEVAKNLDSEMSEIELEEGKKESQGEDITIKIVSVGDIICETSILEDAYNEETGEYSFSHMFTDIQRYTLDADITLGLLETNFVPDEPISGKGKYNSPKEWGETLRALGIDVLHMASNHSLDYGISGVVSTIDFLEELGFATTGIYKTKADAEKILIKDIKGIKIAFLSYTYGSNVSLSSVPESSYCVNIIEKEKIKKDIEKAKASEVDFVFVHMHWGKIDSGTPNQTQKELADFLFANGADFVLGSHPASLQPMEVRETEGGQNVFIAYSTGNFISATKYTNSNIEMILNIEVTKSEKTGETRLTKVTYVPVYLLDNGKGAEHRYKLLDVQEELKRYESGNTEYISQSTYKMLNDAINTIEKLIGKE